MTMQNYRRDGPVIDPIDLSIHYMKRTHSTENGFNSIITKIQRSQL